MARLQWRIQNSLDESRMLMLGVQVMIGFHGTATLEPGFHELSTVRRAALLAGMLLLLAITILLMAAGAHHRVAMRGDDTPEQELVTNRVLCIAFAPVAIVLGLDVLLSSGSVLGDRIGAALGLMVWLGAAALWYAWPRRARRSQSARGVHLMQTDNTVMEQKVRHVLTEARMVLPGVQAMLGFLLIAVLIDGFKELPSALKAAHVGSLLCNAAAMCVLMAPAAYHRIVEAGDATERFHRVASRLLLVGMGLLAGGLALGSTVVVGRITGSVSAGFSVGGGFLLMAVLVWFVWTALVRGHRRKTALHSRHQAA